MSLRVLARWFLDVLFQIIVNSEVEAVGLGASNCYSAILVPPFWDSGAPFWRLGIPWGGMGAAERTH